MDGFALRWEDLDETGKTPAATLAIIGESKAGEPFNRPVARGQAIRISTGAMLPPTCDTVVRVEDTEVNPTTQLAQECPERASVCADATDRTGGFVVESILLVLSPFPCRTLSVAKLFSIKI
jgi:molybdopterin biosynthesis enzyme